MIYLIVIILLIFIILLPNYWAQSVLKKYSLSRNDIPGTGGELVLHLKSKFHLADLQLETTTQGDHYDPATRTVRLSEQNMKGQSLTAVAVAAHEFGHALQHAEKYQPLGIRTMLIHLTLHTEKLGRFALLLLPVLALIPGGIRYSGLMLIVILASMAIGTIVHLVTLPVEIDASFNRALPILKNGNYIHSADYQIVKKILTACALTYLAASLSSLLNFGRWLSFFRR